MNQPFGPIALARLIHCQIRLERLKVLLGAGESGFCLTHRRVSMVERLLLFGALSLHYFLGRYLALKLLL